MQLEDADLGWQGTTQMYENAMLIPLEGTKTSKEQRGFFKTIFDFYTDPFTLHTHTHTEFHTSEQ